MSGVKKSLMCLLWPNDKPDEQIVQVKIDDTDTVANIKKLIKDQYAPGLDKVRAPDLVLWKCSGLPDDDNLEQTLETIRFDGSDNRVHRLSKARELISRLFGDEDLSIEPIHILVIAPAGDTQRNLEHLREYLWGKDRVVSVAGNNYSTIDLSLFRLELNARPDDILLVRNEYVLAYDNILADTYRKQSQGRERSATLVTGQPGIGKTLFLFYVLARRLQEREPVALQINSNEFALFDKHGVSLHSSESDEPPQGAWALSDSSSNHYELCAAFRRPSAHVVYTSSPASRHWKEWVKHLSARTYVMDTWLLEELQTLLTIHNLDVQRGEDLFQKFGPRPRIIINILGDPTMEADYLRDVRAGARALAIQFPSIFVKIESLDFSSDISSEIFALRLDNLRQPILYIPTPFLASILGIAISCQAAAQQHTFFTILSVHPTLCTSAGWLFEKFAHVYFSYPKHEPIQAYLCNDPSSYLIPIPAKIIAGTQQLNTIQAPHNFYWRPLETNFAGINAIIRVGNIVWALQYTISNSHHSAADGLTQVKKAMNHTPGVEWRLVMVGSELCDAELARDSQKQKLKGHQWDKIHVYACELPLGKFTIKDQQRLQVILSKTEDMYLVDQGADSDVSMN